MNRFIKSTEPYVIRMSIVANAQAKPYEPFSANSLICTVMSKNCGVTSKIIAEIAVILLTNDVTKPERKESLISGKVTVINTWKEFAPISYADSSIDLSIWRRADIPERVPVGSDRTTNTITKSVAEP